MNVSIDWNDKTIIYTKGSILDKLCYSMISIIGEQDIDINDAIDELLRVWYDIPAGGIDIADYIHNKVDFDSFLIILRKGLDRLYKENQYIFLHYKNDLENFYKELLKIQESWPT